MTASPPTEDSTSLIHGFQSGPDTRGTFGILIPCLAVIVLNAWTLFHTNIPSPHETRSRRWLHRLKIWVITVIVPDAIVVVAFEQWRLARQTLPHIQAKLLGKGREWSMKHGFYAEMGGYRFRDADGRFYAFRCAEILELLRMDAVELPCVTEAELDDRSDSDGFVKGVACLQSFYFLLSSLARWRQGLCVTTLEVETIPFIFVTWGVYAFWWEKPVNVQQYTVVDACRLDDATLRCLALRVGRPDRHPVWWRPVPGELHERRWDFYWFEKQAGFNRLELQLVSDRIPDHLLDTVRGSLAESRVADWYRSSVNEMHPSQWTWKEDLLLYLLGVALGLLLFITWDYVFPTHIESILWRCSVFLMVGSITVWWPIAWLASRFWDPTSLAKHVFFYLPIGFYMVGRLFILVEPFVGLRALPLSAYQTVSWTKYVPHIS